MNWQNLIAQLLQSLTVGTIAAGLYGLYKAVKALIDRTPLVFAVVQREGQSSYWLVTCTIRNRSPRDLYLERLSIIGVPEAKLHLLDGDERSVGSIAYLMPPHAQGADEYPRATIFASIHGLTSEVRPLTLVLRVRYNRRLLPVRMYRFTAIAEIQRRNLTIKH